MRMGTFQKKKKKKKKKKSNKNNNDKILGSIKILSRVSHLCHHTAAYFGGYTVLKHFKDFTTP